MKIAAVSAYAARIPRDFEQATGLAGSPARLRTGDARSEYRWAETYRTLYSTAIETTLVRVETDCGIKGWGEAQSPVAPEITKTIIESLLGPVVTGEDALSPEALWDRMYAAMRVRGHTGSFLLDAVAGIDAAVWDICGKAFGQPVFRLLGGPVRGRLPVYVSGLAGSGKEEKLDYARRHVECGATAFKIFLDGSESDCLALVDGLRAQFGEKIDIAVDALWRLTEKSARRFCRELEDRNAWWLEAPLMPENVRGHRNLAAQAEIPIAIGESYRTRFELLPFFESRAVDIVQPDLGRTGITEGRKIASMAEAFHVSVAPHVSIGLGPQIAAAMHFAAASPSLLALECNPKIFEVASRFLLTPLEFSPAGISAPAGPGLGIEVNEEALEEVIR